MTKVSFVFLIIVLLSGCSESFFVPRKSHPPTIESEIKIDPREKNQVEEKSSLSLQKFRQQEIISEKVSASETRFLLPSEIVEFSWGDPDRLVEIMKGQELSFEAGKEIEFTSAQYHPSVPPKKGIVSEYVLDQKSYQLRNMDGTNMIGKVYVLEEDGREILRAPMCYGADGPILDIRLVERSPAISFAGECIAQGNAILSKSNIFYQGKTINETYNFDESHYLFGYQGRLGFVGSKEGMEYIFFDGKIVSSGYESIITSSCCMNIAPLFKIYDNGILLFRALQEGNYYFVQVDLD